MTKNNRIKKKKENIEDPNINLDTEIDSILGIKRVPNKKTILVLSGGAIKGISQLGFLEALNNNGYLKYIDTIAATSVGSIVSLLYVAGYTPKEMFSFILDFDINKIKSPDTMNIINKLGLDDGKRSLIVLERMLKAKDIEPQITFKDLYKLTRVKLIITGTCLNDKKVYYYSKDTYPDMSVLLAVRISFSIPIVFVPVKFENKLHVDGGCIDNFPIQLFKDKLEQVIGIYVCDKREYIENIDNVEDFFINLIQCLLEGVTHNSLKGFEKYTVKIDIKDVSLSSGDITKDKKRELYDIGYSTTCRFIKNFLRAPL